uniref:Uncharacterized protein n=1 Tax=Arundo donax TaxID=35708 RepID=A0A0A8Z0N6_ARUDO
MCFLAQNPIFLRRGFFPFYPQLCFFLYMYVSCFFAIF